MKIPKYQRQVSPQLIPGQRVSPEEMTQATGAAAEFGKTALRVAAAVTDAGIRYQNALDNAEAVTQASKAAADTSIAFNDFLTKYKNKELEIEDYTNADEVQKQFDDFKKNIVEKTGGGLSNPKAQGRYRTWVQKEEVGWIKNLTDQHYTFRTDAALGNAIATIDAFIQAKDYNGLRKYLPELVAAKILTSTEAAKQLITARDTIDKKIEQDNYDSTWDKATSQPNRDIAEQIVKESGLSADNEAKMITRLKTFYETQEIKKKEAETQAVNQWEAEALKKFRDNTFSVTDIDTAPKGIDKVQWEDRLNRHNKALLEGKKSPFEEYDPATYAEVSNLVDAQAETSITIITPQKIRSYVGKGLNGGLKPEQAEHFIDRLGKRRDDETFRNTQDAIKGVFGYEGLLTGFGNKPLGGIYYNNAMTEILEFVKTTPLKGSELRKKMYEIAEPHMYQYWESIKEPQSVIKQKLEAIGIKYSPSNFIVQPPKETPEPVIPGTVPKRNPGESLLDYNKRLGR